MRIGTTVQRYSRISIALLGCMVAGVVSVLLMNAVLADGEKAPTASDERLISLHDKGVERNVITKARTVREVLKVAQVEIAEGQDVVEPGLDEELIASKYNINIYRARPITIVDGALRQRVTTAHQTPKQIAQAADIVLYPEDTIETHSGGDLLVNGADTILEINRATPILLTLYGKQTEVRTHATTVGDVLKEKKIVIGKDDTLSVAINTPITEGLHVELWRNGTQTVSIEEDVDFTVEKIQDANRDVGYREVKEPGKKGKRNVTYEIDMLNGQEVRRQEIASVVTKEPKKQVEVVGAKFNYTGGPLTEAQIQALGTCESGMTATRNSGNGFYGAFQFMPSTWRNNAPAPFNQGLPHEAPLEAQKQAVQNLLSRSNIFTQFPGCANKMRAQGIL